MQSLLICSDMHMDIEMANDLISCTTDWTNDYTCADTVIIMTCAFGIKKHYSMYVIADVLRNVKPGSRVIATGCLTKINENELKAIPNLEVKSLEEVKTIIGGKTSSSLKKNKIKQNTVIISNGCLKKCSYCAYSLIEKKYVSKPIENILEEVREIAKYESIIYITGAHETSDYGIDLYGKRKISELLNEICKEFPKCKFVIGWFHPIGLTDSVIDTIATHSNIIQIMLHIQHNDNEILKSMNRPKFEVVESKIQKLHLLRPDLSISTEVIVGFPGETEEKFNALVKYLEESRTLFQDIGVACYEPVLNTKAALLPNLPDYAVRSKRMNIIKNLFGATAYPAPKDFTPLLSSYFEACFLLSKVPNICIKDDSRQMYPYIAGTDTEFKMNLALNIQNFEFDANMLQNIMECNEKFTPSFQKWLLQKFCK